MIKYKHALSLATYGVRRKVVGLLIALVIFMTPLLVYAQVCPPPPDPIGQRLPPTVIPSMLYHATGGPDIQHNFKGTDAAILAGDFRNLANQVEMWHTKDWVAYHIETQGRRPITITICMGDPEANAAATRPVAVYLTTKLPTHDQQVLNLPARNRQKVADFIVFPPKQTYTKSVTSLRNAKFLIIELVDGEFVFEDGVRKDQNLFIEWSHVTSP